MRSDRCCGVPETTILRETGIKMIDPIEGVGLGQIENLRGSRLSK